MIYRIALGEVLRETRNEKKLTLRQAAAGATMALGYLSEIERGKKELSSEILETLAGALSIESHELVFKAALKMGGLQVPDTLENLIDEYIQIG